MVNHNYSPAYTFSSPAPLILYSFDKTATLVKSNVLPVLLLTYAAEPSWKKKCKHADGSHFKCPTTKLQVLPYGIPQSYCVSLVFHFPHSSR